MSYDGLWHWMALDGIGFTMFTTFKAGVLAHRFNGWPIPVSLLGRHLAFPVWMGQNHLQKWMAL
jgi:hypothetical protein